LTTSESSSKLNRSMSVVPLTVSINPTNSS
jgi:hypothetical protein